MPAKLLLFVILSAAEEPWSEANGPEAQSKDPDTAICDHVASRRSHDNVLSVLLKTNREINTLISTSSTGPGWAFITGSLSRTFPKNSPSTY